MATAKYKKNKYVTEDQFNEYTELTEDQVVDKLKVHHSYLEEQELEKKGSELLKEIKGEIKEYRDKWNDENPDIVAEMERLQEEIKAIKADRDTKIESDIEEQKAATADYNDKINGAKAHIRALVFCLRFF